MVGVYFCLSIFDFFFFFNFKLPLCPLKGCSITIAFFFLASKFKIKKGQENNFNNFLKYKKLIFYLNAQNHIAHQPLPPNCTNNQEKNWEEEKREKQSKIHLTMFCSLTMLLLIFHSIFAFALASNSKTKHNYLCKKGPKIFIYEIKIKKEKWIFFLDLYKNEILKDGQMIPKKRLQHIKHVINDVATI